MNAHERGTKLTGAVVHWERIVVDILFGKLHAPSVTSVDYKLDVSVGGRLPREKTRQATSHSTRNKSEWTAHKQRG